MTKLLILLSILITLFTLSDTVIADSEPRQFDSVKELQVWYRQISIVHGDCDDYALELEHMALRDGYMVSFAIIKVEEYEDLFGIELAGDYHALNLVIVGNEVYYLEPQNGEIKIVARVD